MTTDEEKKFSIHKRIKSFVYAYRGIKYLLSTQHNAWIHACAAIMAIALGVIFNITSMEWCVLVACIAIVISAEGFNTAVELIADRVSPQYDYLIGKAKDVAAGAVLITAIGTAIIGVVIFLPKIIELTR